MSARTTAVALCALSLLGCDKIPGLGKQDAGAGGGAPSGGGVFSFLDSSFEGEIAMSVSGKGATTTGPTLMTFGIKSPKIRVDIRGAQGNPMLAQGGGFIVDPPAKKGFLLMPAQKKAMVIDFEKAKAQRSPLPNKPGQGVPSGALTEPPKIEKTGKKETVAGYTCETWKVTSSASRADVCVAEGIKWIDLTDLGMTSPELALAAAASDLNHFPLRVVAYDETNVETVRMEATKIEKKKLDDGRFAVSPGYQLIDMSAMLGNLQGLGAAGTAAPGLPPPRKR